MSTSPVVPTPPPTGSTTPTASNALPSGQSLNNMFLQLLVAQLQNQDPTSPMDPSQFVGQLAQFSELSEVTSIYQLLQQSVPATGGTSSTGGTTPASGSSNGAAAAQAILAAMAAPTTAANPATSPAAVSSVATPSTSFLSPALSAITSKIQGVF